jgi:release factor glutamine methyltransferase
MKMSLTTVGELFAHFRIILQKVYDDRESESLLYILFEELTGLSRVKILAEPGLVIPEEIHLSIQKAVDRLLDHVPVQYIVGKAHFYGLDFFVDEGILIPRPETEELVEWIIRDHQMNEDQNRQSRSQRLLDIGTGSGCIAITLKKHLPHVKVTGTDIFTAVLKTARRNATHNGVKVTFRKHNILMWEKEKNPGSFDIIVGNPPYIGLSEQKAMKENVLLYEPWIALFVDDESLLLFYDSIAAFARKHLNEGGRLYVEINEKKGKDVVALFKKYGLTDVTLKMDIHGRDRMVRASQENILRVHT